MDYRDFMFVVFASFAVGGGLVLALHRSIVHSAFALVAALFGVGGLFWTLGADFLGATQILLYVGGVTVLLLFAVMLTTRDAERVSRLRVLFAVVVAALMGTTLMTVVREVAPMVGTRGLATDPEPTTVAIGDAFLDPQGYLVPFEAIALLLLVVLVGAITVARRGGEA